MKIIFDRQIERVDFNDLMCGDIFRDRNNDDILYMKITNFHEDYNCIRLDSGAGDYYYADDTVFPVEYEFRVMN